MDHTSVYFIVLMIYIGFVTTMIEKRIDKLEERLTKKDAKRRRRRGE